MSDNFALQASPGERAVSGRAYPRLVFLMNVIAPYHKPVLDRLSGRYSHLRILLSTAMESNRPWRLAWEGLDVVVQKTITLNRRWRHPKGFSEPLYIHLPVDTVAQLRRFRADVVVSWEMGVRTMLAAAYVRLRPDTKLMVWAEFAESTEYGRGLMRQMIRKALHRVVDGFLVTGESGARYLSGLGVPGRKLHKIVYTTDVERFAQAAIARPPAMARRLLYVGQLIERKGLLPFLEALKIWALRHPDQTVELALAGDGPLRQRLEQFARPPNVSLTFLGNVSYEDLPRVYAQAGIFVFPTLADTWGVVVNEALASGLPVLGSMYGQAVSELVRDNCNGWIFHPDLPDEMHAAIDRCLSASDDELDRMRGAARETALRLTPDYVAGLVDAAILACCRSRNNDRDR